MVQWQLLAGKAKTAQVKTPMSIIKSNCPTSPYFIPTHMGTTCSSTYFPLFLELFCNAGTDKRIFLTCIQDLFPLLEASSIPCYTSGGMHCLKDQLNPEKDPRTFSI